MKLYSWSDQVCYLGGYATVVFAMQGWDIPGQGRRYRLFLSQGGDVLIDVRVEPIVATATVALGGKSFAQETIDRRDSVSPLELDRKALRLALERVTRRPLGVAAPAAVAAEQQRELSVYKLEQVLTDCYRLEWRSGRHVLVAWGSDARGTSGPVTHPRDLVARGVYSAMPEDAIVEAVTFDRLGHAVVGRPAGSLRHAGRLVGLPAGA